MRTNILVTDSLRKGGGEYSKKDVLNETGLAWGTVCGAADALLQNGYAQTINRKPVGKGRPVVPIRLTPDSAYFLGIDIGSTQTKAVLFDLNFSVIHKDCFKTKYFTDSDAFSRWLLNLFDHVLQNIGTIHSRIRAIGLSVSGNVDGERKIVVSARNFGIEWGADLPLAQTLQEHSGIPVHLVTSQAAGVWGEYHFGKYAGCQNLVCISLGVGIGSGVVADGQLILSMPNRPVGYIGHLLIPGNPHVCSCGFRGCLEAFSGGNALAVMAKEKFPDRPDIRSARALDEVALAGDPTARKILTTAAAYNTAGIVSMIQLYLPEVIIFTGRQSTANGFLFHKTMDKLKKTLPAERLQRFTFDISSLGTHQAAFGAARLAYENLF